jgi:GNAT superfamily N-acetyltransferase/DNA-binding MarR family transcriptional regulator
MSPDDFHRRVERVRQFNRFYTERIRVLDDSFLGSPFSLAQARVLYEIASRGRTKGYLSRLLRGLRKQNLVASGSSKKDARVNVLRLTEKGRAAFADLNARSHNDIGAMLGVLPPAGQRRLVSDMRDIERLLKAPPLWKGAQIIRPHVPGDLGWIVHRHGALYWEEHRWDPRFEALVARVVADFADGQDRRREGCWIAEVGGEPVGSVMITRAHEDDKVAKLRLLLVEPRARGRGIGHHLLEEAIGFARRARYERVALWTVSGLDAAQRLYERAGFKKVHEEPLAAFGHELTSETWELEL